MKGSMRKSLITSAVLAAITASTGAYAQLEEVIVTAERRESNIQDTPISIEALTAEAIERRGVVTVADLFNTIPGVQGYEAPSSRGNISLNIRGVGSGNSNSPSTDPANALYIDNVYIGKATGNGVDAMDLERIEVLRGPQGTLYGRNSTGGAVNFITRKPGDEFALKVKVSGGDYSYGAIQGRVDLPITEDLKVSASFYDRSRDDFYGNSNSAVDGFEDLAREGYRFAVRFTPSDTITMDYSFSHDEIDEHSQMLDVVGFNPTNAAILGAPGVPTNVSIDSTSRVATVAAIQGGVQQLQGAANAGFPGFEGFLAPQIDTFLGWTNDYIAWANGELASFDDKPNVGSSDVSSRSTNAVDGHALNIAWDLGDDMEIRSITGYRKASNTVTGDLDGMNNAASGGVLGDLPLSTIGGLLFNQVVPDAFGVNGATEFQLALGMIDTISEFGSAPVFNNYAETDYKQFSQEFQILGSFDTTDYVIGLYYYEDESQFRNHRIASFPLATSDTSSYDIDSEVTALFGEVTWKPSEDSPWALTVGGRYTEESKDVTYLWRGYNSNFINRYFGHLATGGNASNYDTANNYVTNEQAETLPERAGIYGRTFTQDFDNLSGKVTVMYSFTDDVNVYGTYSTGYRSGGFNGDFFDTANDTADAFGEEDITSMELGLKSQFWDGRAQLNAAIFSYEYDDLQVSTVLAQGNTVTSAISNAGSTTREGLEASFIFQPIENVTANISWTHMEGNFDEYPAVTASSADGGAVLPMNNLAQRGLSPDDQITFGVDWDVLRGEGNTVTFSLNGAWQTETYSVAASTAIYDTNGNTLPDLPIAYEQRENQSRTLINARLGWALEMADSNMEIAIWGTNLTDEDYRAFGFNYGSGLGLNVHQYGAPRMYGIDLTIEL
jgi:iron complex outermembrane receptor protein